ncbi:capsule biosynthesis GfcC family protein [Alteromonas sp. D210916BOD_24]|uniref:capsule biosynthesis GfcC family protein n=1 Tax=Alteromonas sp. D210916BOD_24 TaxID=3157618 RepID=UPI00399CE745
MKCFTTLLAMVAMAYSSLIYASSDGVTVVINQQTYQFDRPIRLASALSIVADNGDWYWPTAAAFNLNDPQAEREKAQVLDQIRQLLTHFDANSDTYATLNNLYEQISNWTVSTRIDIPVSYNRARLFYAENPMLQPGKYWLRLNGRPNVVHFSGVVLKPGAYQHLSDTSIYTAVHSIKKAKDVDRSYVYVIDPKGKVEKKGIAYWNLDFAQLMPGSQVYVPISSELFSNKLKELNERIAALAVHRVLPQ